MTNEAVRVAAVQASPVFLDREGTLERVRALTLEAAGEGARLVTFPEAFVPGYPLWVWFIPPGRTAELREPYAALVAQSVTVPGPAVDSLAAIAQEASVHLAIGVNEINAEASGGTLYNTLLLLGPAGELVGHHRKLVPTAAERLVWAPGDAAGLRVHDIGWARLGGLICWENYMPLARFTLWAEGAQIHVAPTWDRGEPWTSSMRHIAKEGRVWVVSCCSAMRRDDVPDDWEFKASWLPATEWINPGGSLIADPDGKLVVEPVLERQEILYADVPPATLTGPRFQLDVAGHYARPDVFDLSVRRERRPMLRALEPEAPVERAEVEEPPEE